MKDKCEFNGIRYEVLNPTPIPLDEGIDPPECLPPPKPMNNFEEFKAEMQEILDEHYWINICPSGHPKLPKMLIEFDKKTDAFVEKWNKKDD